MPGICSFKGINIYIYYNDHMPPHFHAICGDDEILVSIDDAEIIKGSLPNKLEKMVIGWAVLHEEELKENWRLAKNKQELFKVKPL